MQPAMYSSGASTVRADTLFVSVLRRSDEPSVIQVRQTDPRDPDVVRAKALARARLADSSRTNSAH